MAQRVVSESYNCSLHNTQLRSETEEKALAMYSAVAEELPLLRAKGSHVRETTGPTVGPGSYELDYRPVVNSSRAPFNSTSSRKPLLSAEPEFPGPGTYEVQVRPREVAEGIGSQPFVSESARFAGAGGDDVPGPGAYDVSNYGTLRTNPRSHTFSAPNDGVAGSGAAGGVGPGCYSPNYAAAARKHPKATDFGRYSGREVPRLPAGPGPGSYEPPHGARSLAASKPSSMFVTKTKRSAYGGASLGDAPGPGSYEVGMNPDRGATFPREQFSAFGSSTSRFARGNDTDTPGPGAYTGVIAPRRFHPSTGGGTAAFVSEYDRFPWSMAAPAPGPGTYDGRRPPRHENFGEPMPFGSTVPRFSKVWSLRPLSEPLDFGGDGGRGPMRRRGRPFIHGKIQPSSAPPPLPYRDYNVRYDWPKPTSMANTTFGASSRPVLHHPSAVPGPGTYCGLDDAGAAGRHYGASTWGRDVRFSETLPTSGSPDPGKYYHASTLLKKTFNTTIGSDTALMH